MDEKPTKITANQIAYQALRAQGLSKCQAAKELGLSSSYPAYLERTGKLKYDLADKKIVSKAHKVIKHILEGKPIGDSEPPKPATILQAATEVYNRYQPTDQRIEHSGQVEHVIIHRVVMSREDR